MILVTTTGGSVLFSSFIKVNYTLVSTIPTLKHELLNSLLTFSSRKVPTNTDLVWVADAKSLQQRRQFLTALHMAVEKFVCMRIFLRFQGTYDSEWVILKWSNETGWKF